MYLPHIWSGIKIIIKKKKTELKLTLILSVDAALGSRLSNCKSSNHNPAHNATRRRPISGEELFANLYNNLSHVRNEVNLSLAFCRYFSVTYPEELRRCSNIHFRVNLETPWLTGKFTRRPTSKDQTERTNDRFVNVTKSILVGLTTFQQTLRTCRLI